MSRSNINKCRSEIDKLDDELLELFNRRAEAVIELGRLKAADGIPLYDAAREQEIFARLAENNRGPLSSEAIARLFERIIDESRRIERSEAFDGPEKE